MKKSYMTPNAEIVTLNALDVITLSAPDDLAGYDDTVTAPDDWFS